jgi:hypothetical protein
VPALVFAAQHVVSRVNSTTERTQAQRSFSALAATQRSDRSSWRERFFSYSLAAVMHGGGPRGGMTAGWRSGRQAAARASISGWLPLTGTRKSAPLS